jgi:5-methylcytosine-specific restriction endonuclease McrA
VAGDWIKFECNLPEKPEVLAITAALGLDDPDATVGKLMRLFRWFDQHTTDGNAKRVTGALLDKAIGVSGLAQALIDVGWLHPSAEGMRLEKFDRHNGASAKARSETAKRVAAHRSRKADGADERVIIPRPVRATVLARDGHKCVYCGRKEGEYGPMETERDGYMHIDHVIPTTRGGSNDLSNLVAACGPCNNFKNDRTPDECGLAWPTVDGKRAGNSNSVTGALARGREEEEKKEPVCSSAGEICKALKSAGLAKVNPAHPTLAKLLGRGATVELFLGAVESAKDKRDPFAYLLAVVDGQLADADKPAKPRASTNKQEALEAQNRAVAERFLKGGADAPH